MLMMMGYNFCGDGNFADPVPNSVSNINNILIQNGVFDHYNVTNDVAFEYSPTIPTTWTGLTLMDCDFNQNISAGNLSFQLEQIDGFKIKRRKTSEFIWIDLYFIPKSQLVNFNFTFQDNLGASLQEYEYAIVPVIGGVEGNYISNTISTTFNGVFISDLNTIYRFYGDAKYGSSEQVQKIGVFEPFGKQYPVYVSNSLINYQKGSFQGKVMGSEFYTTGVIDRLAISKERNTLIQYLTNKKAKILKDSNGNIWLVIIVDNPSTNYVDSTGMAVLEVGANYVEIGDSNTQADLYNSGIISQEV